MQELTINLPPILVCEERAIIIIIIIIISASLVLDVAPTVTLAVTRVSM